MEKVSPVEQLSFSALVASLRGSLRRDLGIERREDLVEADAALTNVLVELRQGLNARTPIDKLPPEILVQIFELALRLSGSHDTPKLHQPAAARAVRTRPLLELSHVSSKWRAVALKTAALWTRVDNHDEAQLETFLERSQAMPLSLHLLTKDASSFDRLLKQEGHRIRRLEVTEYPHWVHPPAHLQVKLPLLECFTLSSQCEPVRNDDSEATPILFGERVCEVRAFALKPLYMWIPGNHFPFLTHLYLATFHGRMLYDDTMRYLTGLLSNTPVLEYLFLSGVQAAAVITETSTRATLPCLRALTCVDSDLAAALLLLERVQLPQDVLVRLDGLYCHNSDNPNGDEYLPRRLPSERLLASLTRLEVVADDTALHLVAEGARSGLWIRAECTGDMPDQWAPWLAALHRMLPLESIRRLHVSLLVPDLLADHLLARMPSLVELGVRIHPDFHMHDEGPCWALLADLYWALGQPETEARPLLCPALERLGVEIYGGDPEDFRLPPASEVVPRMVKARAAAGKPLRRLVLQPHLERDLKDGAPEVAVVREMFRAALEPLERHVDVAELAMDKESAVCPLKMNEMWKVGAFEQYWALSDDERARYRVQPWTYE